jgi:hypothetical protein
MSIDVRIKEEQSKAAIEENARIGRSYTAKTRSTTGGELHRATYSGSAAKSPERFCWGSGDKAPSA